MRPLFPFYGSKWNTARHYPPPRGTVIEPFAGSAGYSTFYAPARVVLYDKDPILVGVWQYLIHVKPSEVLGLPDLDSGETVDALVLPQEAKWLIGFWLNRGSSQPKKTKTVYSARTDRAQLIWGERARERIARDVEGVRQWKVFLGDYTEVCLEDGTWFVDPPYVVKGCYYRYHTVDYANLARWCCTLPGQVIVCEQEGANWLPFHPLRIIKSTKGMSAEVVYTNKKKEEEED